MKVGPERELLERYRKRLTWSLEIIEIDDRKIVDGTAERRLREARLLAIDLPGGAVSVALDERGHDLASRDFAARLGDWRNNGRQPIVFMIGGADGLDPALVAKSDLALRFGGLTWPHMMVRAMLVEQIFRAQSIDQGHPYHRD